MIGTLYLQKEPGSNVWYNAGDGDFETLEEKDGSLSIGFSNGFWYRNATFEKCDDRTLYFSGQHPRFESSGVVKTQRIKFRVEARKNLIESFREWLRDRKARKQWQKRNR